MRYAAVMLAMLLVFTYLPATAWAEEQYTSTTMRLLATVGTVNITGADGTAKETVDNARLESGDHIRTGAGSRASIGLDTDRIVTLDELGEVDLEKRNGALVLTVRQGVLFFDVRRKLNDNESMEIRTSTMAMGIRGTQGGIAANVHPKALETNEDGKAVLTTDTSRLLVSGAYITEGLVDIRFAGRYNAGNTTVSLDGAVLPVSAGQGVEIYSADNASSQGTAILNPPVAVSVDPNLRITYNIEEVKQDVVTNQDKAENLLAGFGVQQGNTLTLNVFGVAAEDAYTDDGDGTSQPAGADKNTSSLSPEQPYNSQEGSEVNISPEKRTPPDPEDKHSMIHVEAKAGTCTSAGNKEFYYCPECGKYFTDSEGNTEITGSDIANLEITVPHNLTEKAAVEASCEKAGHVHYYQCSTCGKCFSDNRGANALSNSDLEIPALGHSLEYVETGTTAGGTSGYYQCIVCGKYFSDAAGKTEISEAETETK